jgi:hypothetical protein
MVEVRREYPNDAECGPMDSMCVKFYAMIVKDVSMVAPPSS